MLNTMTDQNETPDEFTPNADEAVAAANLDEVREAVENLVAGLQEFLHKIG